VALQPSQAGEEKLLKIPVKKTRYLMLVGYILRIFPYLNVLGSILIVIGWAEIKRRVGGEKYLLGLLGSTLMLVTAVYAIVVESTSLLPGVTGIEATPTWSLEELKSSTIKMLSNLKKQLSSPAVYLTNAFMGLALIFEAFAVSQLATDTKRLVPRYLAVLFAITGIFYVVESAVQPLVASSLDSVIESVKSARDYTELARYITIDFIAALLPLLAVAFVVLVMVLVTYILFGYKYYKLREHVLRVATLTGTGEAGAAELI